MSLAIMALGVLLPLMGSLLAIEWLVTGLGLEYGGPVLTHSLILGESVRRDAVVGATGNLLVAVKLPGVEHSRWRPDPNHSTVSVEEAGIDPTNIWEAGQRVVGFGRILTRDDGFETFL
ncbi:hypothetical protein NM208_g15775 [Fusarium decemcellulare]|uniref:Uncharacterized protein n=1 Tax=Fusarium decemcellulare TaxID=57161 RepID=A0ACC1RDB8_9HYPO|nr:hypothetical protein NM208_g15775 [Fusarium decemcellulare]